MSFFIIIQHFFRRNDKRIEIYHPKILTQCTFSRQIGAQKAENIKNKMAFTKN